jgi:hypothetical protein
MSSEPKQLKDYSAEVKAAVPEIVEEAYKEVCAKNVFNGIMFAFKSCFALLLSHQLCRQFWIVSWHGRRRLAW